VLWVVVAPRCSASPHWQGTIQLGQSRSLSRFDATNFNSHFSCRGVHQVSVHSCAKRKTNIFGQLVACAGVSAFESAISDFGRRVWPAAICYMQMTGGLKLSHPYCITACETHAIMQYGCDSFITGPHIGLQDARQCTIK
jgi:hypothetical protein